MPDTLSGPDESPAAAIASEPTITLESAGSGAAGAQLTNTSKGPLFSEGNCVVVPKPPKGGLQSAFIVVQATSTESPRRFSMELSGRESVWLAGEDASDALELLEDVPYELTFAKGKGGVAVQVLRAGKPVWTKTVPRNRVVEAAADLSAFAGQVTLVVNVASRCGYTPQYEGLQELHAELADRGFAVLGFPSNEFGAQEPGSAEEIREFCTSRFGVTFPMFSKCEVKPGPDQSPVYAYLQEQTGEVPGWNFCKYLVGRDGQVIAFFESGVAPDAPELRKAIEAALG